MDVMKAVESLQSDLWGVWFLIGAALVFWMQAGFAMVEGGFTRAKNAGNIIMKNLMDFCIGTVMFMLIGFSLLLGEDYLGFIGKPGFDLFTNFANFNFSTFVFNLVFCATTATIVSGAMAERTKFLSYCVYSAVISALIYPIEAHWIWGGGWLANLGFHDYAGSCAIHMVGGICALIGAAFLGPRIGKFKKDKSGKVIKVNAIPGHNLTIGALGVFILWLGWYGFNGAAATDLKTLGSIFLTTTVAPAVATVVCMIFTWIKYGKPDVSMCLNASLAGLVAITAPCDVTDALGAAIIGAVAGVLVVFGVWLCDHVLRVDDPVGAWAVVLITLTFLAIRATIGLRVKPEEEIEGLDATEHGLPSAYADFMPAGNRFYAASPAGAKTTMGDVPMEAAVPVAEVPAPTLKKKKEVAEGAVKMSKISIICRQSKFEDLKEALNAIGVSGITVTSVLGCGTQKGTAEYYRGVPVEFTLLPKTKVEVVVSAVPVEKVVDAAKEALYTGHIGDGKIFVYNVEEVVKVRTGESGFDALQDD